MLLVITNKQKEAKSITTHKGVIVTLNLGDSLVVNIDDETFNYYNNLKKFGFNILVKKDYLTIKRSKKEEINEKKVVNTFSAEGVKVENKEKKVEPKKVEPKKTSTTKKVAPKKKTTTKKTTTKKTSTAKKAAPKKKTTTKKPTTTKTNTTKK